MRNNRTLPFVLAGVAALLLIAAILVFVFFGVGKSYDDYYRAAESAFLSRDYDTALNDLNKAISREPTEEAYLLMARIYESKGDPQQAIQVLYLGYTRVGGDRIEAMLEQLKTETHADTTPVPGDAYIVGGKTVAKTETALALNNCSFTPGEISVIASLTELDSLSLSDCRLSDLGFLEFLTKLTSLDVSRNNLKDISQLKFCAQLKTLYLDGNPVEDFTPLYALTGLRTLSMKNIPVSAGVLKALREALPNCSIYAEEPEAGSEDLELGGKTFTAAVTELNLGGLDISDISVLSKCTKLRRLDLRDNRISDISPLMDLQDLEWLCLWNNDVSDIYPLLSLTKLSYLDLEGNNIRDISVVAHLTALEELWLNGNPVKSVEPISGITDLLRLGLQGVGLKDEELKLLTGLKKLTEMTLRDNPALTAGSFEALQNALPNCAIAHDTLLYSVTLGSREFQSDAVSINAAGLNVRDLTGLENFTALKSLNLGGNSVTDISPLKALTGLEKLELYGNRISDISALAGHSALTQLNLEDNEITDAAALADCVHLKKLNLRNNELRSVTPLAACSELEELDLGENELTGIRALAPLTSLKVLHLEDNDISDLSALYSLVNLETLYVSGNDLTDDDIRALQTMLPNCYVADYRPVG